MEGKDSAGKFVKGHKMTTGRPKEPAELQFIKRMTKAELELLMNKLLALSKKELEQVKINGNGIEMAMASIILNAVDRGDQWRLQFFIERLFGKVSDKLEIDDKSGLADKLNRFKSKK